MSLASVSYICDLTFGMNHLISLTKQLWVSVRILTIYLFLLILFGCQSDEKSVQETEVIVTQKTDSVATSDTVHQLLIPEVYEPDRQAYFNLFVKLICGKSDSLPGIDFNQEYVDDYAKELTKGLKKLNRKRLLPLRQWYDNVLMENDRNDSLVAFYPFSGGDFLHLYNVYPNSNTYLMLAIEPVGSVPRFDTSTGDSLSNYLKSLKNTLRDVWNRSYFITKHMQEDIKEDPNVDGMLMSILWGVGATGHEISVVKSVKLDSLGTLITAPIDSIHRNMFDQGVEITFFDPKDCGLKTVVYLRCNISDKGIKKNQRLERFLNQLPRVNTFIKAASYLPHYGSFSMIREAIIHSSENLLQDDTGVPFKDLQADSMKVFLYGDYVLPLKVFGPKLFQKDMKKKYADTNYYRGDLPFSMGYHVHTKSQSQLVAMRNQNNDSEVVASLISNELEKNIENNQNKTEESAGVGKGASTPDYEENINKNLVEEPKTKEIEILSQNLRTQVPKNIRSSMILMVQFIEFS